MGYEQDLNLLQLESHPGLALGWCVQSHPTGCQAKGGGHNRADICMPQHFILLFLAGLEVRS